MKKLLLTAVALAGFTAGVMAQGYFQLDGNSIANGVAINTSGNYYDGPFNMEVWELNAAAVPAGINLAPAPGAGVLAYNAMTAASFTKEPAPTFTFGGGVITLAQAYKMPDVTPKGSTVVVAVAAWNNTAASWSAMLAGANASTRAGVLAWVQPTADYSTPPTPPAPANAWPGQDLVMTAVPEPGTLVALATGLVGLLCLRRRK